MRKSNNLLVFLVICGFMSACSGPQSITQAPTSQADAKSRFIIKGSKADTQAVIAASKAYRVLNADHNLYEVQGLNYFEIKDIAPSISAEQNQVFKSQSLNKTINPYKAMSGFMATNEETPKEENEEAPQAAELPPALQGCVVSIGQPTVKLNVTDDLFAEQAMLNLNESVQFSGTGSASSNPEKPEIFYQWDVIPPMGSSIQSGLRTGEFFDLTVDMVGLYRIVLVIRDETNACALVQAQFVVTHNPDIEFAREDEEKPEIEIEAFTHLARMDVPQAWEKAKGKDITIAVLDSGLHYNHRAIKFNLAFNPTEKEGIEGEDDDGNSFTDDVLGWDFVNSDNKPFDDDGHGSHVSGLISSHLIGVAKQSKVLPIKVLSAAGTGDVGSVVAAVYYAVDNGADIINASLGGSPSEVPAMTEALQYAHSQGVPFVVASGNSNLDLSLPGNDVFPGEADLPNVINVAAVGEDQNLASYSNFGKDETDVAAPGGDGQEPIYSLATLNPENIPFIGQGGTSMACPLVAGVVALMLEQNPSLTPEQVRTTLMKSGQQYPELADKVGSGRILSALEALGNENQQSIVGLRGE